MATFEVTATTTRIMMNARVESLEVAKAVATEFPKSYKVYGNTLSTFDLETRQNVTAGWVGMEANLVSDDVNKGANESGLARIRKAIVLARKNGHEVVYIERFANGLTEDEFNAL